MRSAVWGGADFAITQPFNPPVHMGIDIGCPSGTPIYAARRGYVERSQTGMVSVQVGATYVTLTPVRDFYLHGNPAPGIGVGSWVDEGDLIIYSDTVQVDPRFPLTGPHLHFEIQDAHNLPGIPSSPGGPLDPVPVLAAAQFKAGPPPPPPPPPTWTVAADDGHALGTFTTLISAQGAANDYAIAHPGVTVKVTDSHGNVVFTAFIGYTPAPPAPPAPPGPPVPPAPTPADPQAAQSTFWSWVAQVLGQDVSRWLQGLVEQASHLRDL